MYQVFNKATKEEYEIYSKLFGGTVFTNIETILFDWSIRRAFAISQVPDMEITSAVYGEQVYNICKALFKDVSIQDRLDSFVDFIKLNRIREQEKNAKEELDKLLANRGNSFPKYFKLAITFLFVFLIVAMISIILDFFVGRTMQNLLFMIVMMTIIISIVYAIIASGMFERRKQTISINEARQEANRLREEKLSLIKKMGEAEKTQDSK